MLSTKYKRNKTPNLRLIHHLINQICIFNLQLYDTQANLFLLPNLGHGLCSITNHTIQMTEYTAEPTILYRYAVKTVNRLCPEPKDLRGVSFLYILSILKLLKHII